jgi:hypothetical protein
MRRINDFSYIKLNNKNSNDLTEILIVFVSDGLGKNACLILFPGAKNISKKARRHEKNAITFLSKKIFLFNIS